MQQNNYPPSDSEYHSLGGLSSAGQINDLSSSISSITSILSNLSNNLIALKREFRGEMMYQDEEGSTNWVQVSKPVFIRTDPITEKPIKTKQKMPDGSTQEVYIPNDEAIDEILSMLKFSGINNVSPIGFNQPDNYQDDLREFECKLAAVLCLKQKEWGLDKELLPMLQFKIKTIVQDARSLSIKGNTLKAIQTTVQRIEQSIEGEKTPSRRKILNPYKQTL